MCKLYECEKKLHFQRCLTFPHEKTKHEDISEDPAVSNFSVTVSDNDIARFQSDMDAIVYIAGHVAHTALKKVSCSACFSRLDSSGKHCHDS